VGKRRTTPFDRLAREARFAATQAEILSEVVGQIPDYLERRRPAVVLSPETVFVEHFGNSAEYLQWLTPVLMEYLQRDAEFNQETGRSVVYRYVFLPITSREQNWFERRRLIQSIIMTLHVQLWFGVICGVYFVDQATVTREQLLTLANFACVPHADLLFDVPGFHSENGIDLVKVRGDETSRRISAMIRTLAGKNVRPLWLFYDELNFSRSRLSGWRWSVLRQFFERLCAPMRCVGCGTSIRRFALDHIAPIAAGHFQTLVNFQPLCKMCNSAKGAQEGDDPFGIRLIIPPQLQTHLLDDVMRQAPRWLGTVRRPQTSAEIRATLEKVGAT
jgi:hypothetical protein